MFRPYTRRDMRPGAAPARNPFSKTTKRPQPYPTMRPTRRADGGYTPTPFNIGQFINAHVNRFAAFPDMSPASNAKPSQAPVNPVTPGGPNQPLAPPLSQHDTKNVSREMSLDSMCDAIDEVARRQALEKTIFKEQWKKLKVQGALEVDLFSARDIITTAVSRQKERVAEQRARDECAEKTRDAAEQALLTAQKTREREARREERQRHKLEMRLAASRKLAQESLRQKALAAAAAAEEERIERERQLAYENCRRQKALAAAAAEEERIERERQLAYENCRRQKALAAAAEEEERIERERQLAYENFCRERRAKIAEWMKHIRPPPPPFHYVPATRPSTPSPPNPPPSASEQLARYERKWNALRRPMSEATLSFSTIPWPVLTDVRNVADLTKAAIEEFVSHRQHACLGDEARRRMCLREELLRWHPDKFRARVLDKVDPCDREVILEGAEVVARLLTDMMADE